MCVYSAILWHYTGLSINLMMLDLQLIVNKTAHLSACSLHDILTYGHPNLVELCYKLL
jgi:hypothetical protein